MSILCNILGFFRIPLVSQSVAVLHVFRCHNGTVVTYRRTSKLSVVVAWCRQRCDSRCRYMLGRNVCRCRFCFQGRCWVAQVFQNGCHCLYRPPIGNFKALVRTPMVVRKKRISPKRSFVFVDFPGKVAFASLRRIRVPPSVAAIPNPRRVTNVMLPLTSSSYCPHPYTYLYINTQ